ncbi:MULTISPECIES: helix-turn-helix transcriptional regulator [Clostridium]|uniref:helix-turn-helix transcriptional regulator n=1 Tax=Clostridium TaxID=1485 RepID=UPI0008251B36|nr:MULTISPECIES: HTH domain-containing protein [Clostridium]PJI07107.1 HTH domain-containing protein [Clostridium sp. CT7]
MNKIAKAFKIIELLHREEKLTAKQLAFRLRLSERTIRKYIVDLEDAGIYINTIYGRNGGYTIDKNRMK